MVLFIARIMENSCTQVMLQLFSYFSHVSESATGLEG